MSVRGFKTLQIANRHQHELSGTADGSFHDTFNRTPSFISCDWNQRNQGASNISSNLDLNFVQDGGNNMDVGRNNIGEIGNLLAKQVHITPRKAGRNLRHNTGEGRRQSCPQTPESVRSSESAQKRLVRRTFHLEDQLSKSGNPDPRSPCLFRLNCYDTSVPGNSNRSSLPKTKMKSDDLSTNTNLKANEDTAVSLPRRGNVLKEFLFSLVFTVIMLVKWCFIGVFCIILAVAVQHSYTVYQTQRCSYYTQMNMTSLREVLSGEVYGQRLVTEAVVSNIEQYLSDPEQDKPLVLSFYGWTGVGKNFVSGLIADHVRSATVIKIITPLHFPHVQDQAKYAEQLKDWVTSNISSCAVNLFIMDEVDKASWPIGETLREVVQYLNNFNLAEKRAKVIILLLSNKGASLVNRYLYDVLLSGGSRDDVKLPDITEYMLEKTDALSLDVWLSESSPLNQMLPFLPLEKPQVEECIIRDLKNKGRKASSSIIKQIVSSLPFAPKNSPLFSVTGCRKVSSAVDLHSTEN